MLPGQGFKRGPLIAFMATPYPLPLHYVDQLKACAKNMRAARLVLEANPSSKDAADAYKKEVSSLEAVDMALRNECGVTETRNEFLSLSYTGATQIN